MAEFAEVAESEADGKIKVIFADMCATFGEPTVGPLFRRLAVYPWYLQLAWRNLKPNASTTYFHRMEAELEDIADAGRSRNRDHDSDGALSRLHAHSKRLMSTAALRVGTNGQAPKMTWLSAADTQSIAPSPPTQTNAPGVAWDDMPIETGEAFEARIAQIRRAAAMAAESLPYRMEISSTACRQSGLTEDQIDAVRRIIDDAWYWEPRALATIATRLSDSRDQSSPRPEPAPAS